MSESIQLLVSELVTNSYRHGGLTDRDWIEVRFEASDRSVRVEVVDPGRGFAGGVVHERADGDRQDSGWGLYMLRQIADRWGVSRVGGTRVWFEVDRALTPSPAHNASGRSEDRGLV